MNISNLDEFFNITHYQPNLAGRVTVELAPDGSIRVRIPYHFSSVGGQSTPSMLIDAVVTEQQLSNIQAAMVTILQATNAEIELQHGWVKRTKPN